MRIPRREAIRLGLLGVLSLVVAAGSVQYGRGIIKAISPRDFQFATGLDFASYEPSLELDGEPIETVMRWASNTQASDITKWSTSMMARMVSFRPYIGTYANGRDAMTDSGETSTAPNLDNLLSESAKHISAVSYAFDREIGERTLVVNPRLESEFYPQSLWAQASHESQGEPAEFFLTKAFDAAAMSHREKRNVAFEIDKPSTLSFAEFMPYVDAVAVSKKTYASKIPLIVGVSDADIRASDFALYYQDSLKDIADAILIKLPADTVDAKAIHNTLEFARKIVGAKKLYVRIQISHYDNKRQTFALMPVEALKTLMETVQEYADGSFVYDNHGMHLYRGLFGADRSPPLDGGALKALVRQWHQSNVAVGEM